MQLHAIDDLLDQHEGEADARNEPRDQRVHLVGAGDFQGRGAEGVGEHLPEQRGVNGGAGVDVSAAGFFDALEQMGG